MNEQALGRNVAGFKRELRFISTAAPFRRAAVHGAFRAKNQIALDIAGGGDVGRGGPPGAGNSSGVYPGNSSGLCGSPGSRTGGGISGLGFAGGSSGGGSAGCPGLIGGSSDGVVGIASSLFRTHRRDNDVREPMFLRSAPV
jgi:hypothetical protein